MEQDLRSKLPLKEHISNMKKILKVISDIDKHYFHFTCIVHVINVLIPYVTLILSAYILDSIGAEKSFKEIFTVIALTMAGILILQFIASTVWNRMEVRRINIYNIYHCSIQTKMLNMDFSRIDSPEVKDLKDRINLDNNWGAGINSVFWQFNGLLYQVFDIIAAIIVGLPAVGYMIVSKNLSVLWIFGILVIVTVVAMKIKVHYRKLEQEFMYSQIKDEDKEEMVCFAWDFSIGDGYDYRHGKDIRIYNAYELMKRWVFYPIFTPKTRNSIKNGANGFAGTSGAASAIEAAMEGASYLMIAILAIAGNIGVGSVIKLAGCLNKLLLALFGLSNSFVEFAMTARKQMSTIELLELENEMHKGKLPVEKRSDGEYQIEFKNVSFKYPGSDRYALKDFSFKFKIGEKLAIVGMNGSGKTTMIKLLCRLYDPQEGEILLNGVDIRKFKQEEYCKLFSVVFQDYTLFSFKLGENVAIDTEYDAKKVKECLEDVGLGECLSNLENGLDTYFTKNYDDSGVEFSGGELQKIAIARALYKEAPYILLDEPTAALDPIAEYEIYSNFDKIVGTKTAIYISHRLSSCRFCKRIAVFHEGRLIQVGSHEELVQDTKGKYYELWNAQAQYYTT